MPGWKKWLIGVGALIVLAAIFGQSTNTPADAPEQVSDDPDGGGALADPVDEEEDESVYEPPAEPEGKFGLASCEVDLASQLYGQDFLIGSTEVLNTGEVEATIKATTRRIDEIHQALIKKVD